MNFKSLFLFYFTLQTVSYAAIYEPKSPYFFDSQEFVEIKREQAKDVVQFVLFNGDQIETIIANLKSKNIKKVSIIVKGKMENISDIKSTLSANNIQYKVQYSNQKIKCYKKKCNTYSIIKGYNHD